MTDTASTERVSDERLAEMLAGLEGVTPGPWESVSELNLGNGYTYTSVQPSSHDPEKLRHLAMANGEYHVCRMTHTPMESKVRKYRQDAAHIARCDPDSMRSILTELQSLRSAASVGVKAAARKLMGQLVGDGDPSILLVPDNVDANDFANAYADLEAALTVPETEGVGEPVLFVNQRDLDRMPFGGQHYIEARKLAATGSFEVPLYTSPQPAAVSDADGWVKADALAPFLRVAEHVVAHPAQYQGTLMRSGGLSNAADLVARDFQRLLAAAPQPPQPVTAPDVVGLVSEIGVLLDNCHWVEDIDIVAQHEAVMVIVRKLAALPQPMKVDEATHRHLKRSTEYVLMGVGRMQADGWFESIPAPLISQEGTHRSAVDMREVAIYRSATDPTEIWVRPLEEFKDGRFAALSHEAEGEAK